MIYSSAMHFVARTNYSARFICTCSHPAKSFQCWKPFRYKFDSEKDLNLFRYYSTVKYRSLEAVGTIFTSQNHTKSE